MSDRETEGRGLLELLRRVESLRQAIAVLDSMKPEQREPYRAEVLMKAREVVDEEVIDSV